MSISRDKKEKFDSFDLESVDRIIRMAWEDRTSYESIRFQFELSASEIVQFMRYHLDSQSFKRWRRRIYEQGKLKNNPPKDFRFKSKSQRLNGSTKNYK